MKITVLSLEDLTEATTDVVIPADLPEEQMDEMRADAQETEEREAQEAAQAEEQTESQSLIDQVVALEALYEKIASVSEFPAELAMEAYDAAPDAHIMDTYRSGASTTAKISVALEGIMAKAWEAVKRFWAQLVQMWKKFMQYLSRFMNGESKDELIVDQALVTKLETLLHEGEQRRQANQHNGMLLQKNPEEDDMLCAAYFQSGEGRGIPVMAKLRDAIPKCNQFIQVTDNYIRDLERWAQESIKHPNAQTVMPASPESTMHDFVEACTAVRKSIPAIWTRAVEQRVKRVTLAEVMNGIKATVVSAEYGLVRRVESTTIEVIRFAEKRQKELSAYSDKDNADAVKAKIFRALGRELASLREAVSDVFMMFHSARQAQRKMLSVGSYWLWSFEIAYREMTKAKAYSAEDKKKFEVESDYFQKLHHKYDDLLGKKLHSTIV